MKKTILFLILLLMTGSIYAASLIGVKSPAYCSDIQGNTTIDISAPTYSEVKVHCWKQGAGYGTYELVGTVALDSEGAGTIVFPADEYPHGPLNIRISGTNSESYRDNCYLQLYNKGGVSWNEGLPADPPAAAGMKLVFADDFDTELSIGVDPSKHTYYDHKPPYGQEDFSSIPFTSFDHKNNPFSQVDSYLRIRADANKNSAGLISSLFSNNRGIMAKAPCYFECRFIGPNAPGSWPSFWLLSVKDRISIKTEPCDELDVIEAYGGEGPGSPNSKQLYRVTSHAWNQTGKPVQICDQFYQTKGLIDMYNYNILAPWYDQLHIYGCKITETDIIYYCDNIEVARHEVLPISKTKPFYFMINLSTGGGWPVDLSRYDGVIDMYVDYVRVYSSNQSDGVESAKNSAFDVTVSPNPVDTESAISFNVPAMENISVTLYNSLGQQVFTHGSRQEGDVKIPVNMSGMDSGLYFAKINVGNLQVSKTIIKK